MIVDEEKWAKYVEILKAWYSNKVLQHKCLGSEWSDYNSLYPPTFDEDKEYRLKPKMVSLNFCVVLCKLDGKIWLDIVTSEESFATLSNRVEVKKVGDWKTVVVEAD
jgi:hypothetical protein